jgi:prepilin-type N-terminal cleavage/methylation domain-containing protein
MTMNLRKMLGRKGRRGTSLVEVMIAMAILAFVLLAFLSIMNSSSQMSASSKETAIAVYILQSTMEDTFSTSYGGFWSQYCNNTTGLDPYGVPMPPSNTRLYEGILADPVISSSLPTLLSLLPRVQGTALPPLNSAESATWLGIVETFKNKTTTNPHNYVLTGTGRLKNEQINLYMMPTSDIYQGAGFKPGLDALSHNYIEYTIEITWTDSAGKLRRESITTRRSQ